MQKLIKLNTHFKFIFPTEVLLYDKPAKVYFPLSKEDFILTRKNAYALIGTPLIKNVNKINNSSISGVVTQIKKVNTIDGEKDAIEIVNDYKENKLKIPFKRNLTEMSKYELKFVFKILNITLDKDILVINCLDTDYSVYNECFYIFLYYVEFLEILKIFIKIFQLKEILICIKASNSKNIKLIVDYLKDFTNIRLKIIPDLYLLGRNKNLLEYLCLENEASIIQASLFYEIYYLIINKAFVNDKLITISGDSINKQAIVKVKIGTKLDEIFKKMFKLEDDIEVIANGLMQGKVIDYKNFIITKDVNSIIVMKKNKRKEASNCINCGACIDICPVNLNPKLFINKKYHKKAKDKCLKCGLCSYICPSYINFNNIIKGEENEI